MSARQTTHISANGVSIEKPTKVAVSVPVQEVFESTITLSNEENTRQNPIYVEIDSTIENDNIVSNIADFNETIIPLKKKRYNGALFLPLLMIGVVLATVVLVGWSVFQGKSQNDSAQLAKQLASPSKSLVQLPKGYIAPPTTSSSSSVITPTPTSKPAETTPTPVKNTTTAIQATQKTTEEYTYYQPPSIVTTTNNPLPSYASGSITSSLLTSLDSCPHVVAISGSISVNSPTNVTWNLLEDSYVVASGTQQVDSYLPVSANVTEQNGLHTYTLLISAPNSYSVSISRFVTCVEPTPIPVIPTPVIEPAIVQNPVAAV
jgi:hypothetical protein